MKKVLYVLSTILMLTVIVVGITISTSAEDVIHSGTSGSLSWELNETTGELTISGNGSMSSFSSHSTSAWRNYKSKIKNVNIESGVTSIGFSAFSDCKSLTSVNFGANSQLTSIEEKAFWGCNSLTSIRIPSSVTYIGDEVFSYCYNLTSIEIPGSVTYIGNEAFSSCRNLTSVNVDSNNIQYCSQNGVLYNKKMTDLICYPAGKTEPLFTIPSSVMFISEHAFYSCDRLCSIEIPRSVEFILSGAFYGCDSLSSVTFEDNSKLKLINVNLFRDCTSLNSVSFGANSQLTSIGGHAFSNCSSLTSIEIPSSVTRIDDMAFSGCYKLIEVCNKSNLLIQIGSSSYGSVGYYAKHIIENQNESYLKIVNDYIFYDDGITIYLMGYRGNSEKLILPAYGNQAYEIYQYAFYNRDDLTNVVVSAGVTSIGENAFKSCIKLIEVCNKSSLPIQIGASSYGYIGYYAKHIIKDPNESYLKIVNDYVFYDDGTFVYLMGYQGAATELILPTYENQAYEIYRYAFYDRDDLTNVVIPSDVTSIGDFAFGYCLLLSSVTFGANSQLTSIGHGSFLYCVSLNSIDIPSGVTSIGDLAFSDCSVLTSIEIPSNVMSIGDCVFDGCRGLTSITIPYGVTSIGDYTFGGCISLTSIEIPQSMMSIGYGAFDGCDSLTNITIPDSVTNIGSEAFLDCDNLTNITIPSSVTSIEPGVFRNCDGLTNITIPSSVTSIGQSAFEGCESLTSIIYHGTEEKWNAIQKGNDWDRYTGEYSIIFQDSMEEGTSAPTVDTVEPSAPVEPLDTMNTMDGSSIVTSTIDTSITSDTVEQPSSGCGSAIGGTAWIGILSLGAVFLIRRKKDE